MAGRIKARSTIPAWICRSNHIDPHVLRLGETDDIKVEVTGIPTPKVKFFLGPKELKDGTYYKIRKSRFVYILTVVQATEDLNENELVVTATNSAGSDVLVLDIKVYRILRADSKIVRKARSQTLRAPDSVFVQRRQKLRVLRGGQSLCSLGSISSLPGKHGHASSQYSIPTRHAQLLQMSMDEDVFLDSHKANQSQDAASYYINDSYYPAGDTSFGELEDLESPPRGAHASSTFEDTNPSGSPSSYSGKPVDSGFESDQQKRKRMFKSTDDMYADQGYVDPRFSYGETAGSSFSTFKSTPALQTPHSPEATVQVHDIPEQYSWQQQSLLTQEVTTENAHDHGSLKKKKKKKKSEDGGSEDGDKTKKKRKKRAAPDSMNDQSFRSDLSGQSFPPSAEGAQQPVYQNLYDVNQLDYGIQGEVDHSFTQPHSEPVSPVILPQSEHQDEPKKKKKKKRGDSRSRERTKSADAVETDLDAHMAPGQSTYETVLTDQQMTTVITDHEAKRELKKKKKKKHRDGPAHDVQQENVDPTVHVHYMDDVLMYGANANPSANTPSESSPIHQQHFETDIDPHMHQGGVQTDFDSYVQNIETTIDSPGMVHYGEQSPTASPGRHFETDIDAPVGQFETDIDAPVGQFETDIDAPVGQFETDIDSPAGQFETDIDSYQVETTIDSPVHHEPQLETNFDAYHAQTDIDFPADHSPVHHIETDIDAPMHYDMDNSLSVHQETDIDSFVHHAAAPAHETDLDSYVPPVETNVDDILYPTETSFGGEVTDQPGLYVDDALSAEQTAVIAKTEKHKKKKKKAKDGVGDKSIDNSFEVLDDGAGEKDRSLKRKKKKKHDKSLSETIDVVTTSETVSTTVEAGESEKLTDTPVLPPNDETKLEELATDAAMDLQHTDVGQFESIPDTDPAVVAVATAKKSKKSKDGKTKKKKHSSKSTLGASEENLMNVDHPEHSETFSLEQTKEELMASEGDVSAFLDEPAVEKPSHWIMKEETADAIMEEASIDDVSLDVQNKTPETKKKKKKKHSKKSAASEASFEDDLLTMSMSTEDTHVEGIEDKAIVIEDSVFSAKETNIDDILVATENIASPETTKKKKRKSSKKHDTSKSSLPLSEEDMLSLSTEPPSDLIIQDNFDPSSHLQDTVVLSTEAVDPAEPKKKKKKRSSKKATASQSSFWGSQEDILMNVSNDSILDPSGMPDSFADQSIEVFAQEAIVDPAVVLIDDNREHTKKKRKKSSKSASNENILAVFGDQDSTKTPDADMGEVVPVLNAEHDVNLTDDLLVTGGVDTVERKKKKRKASSKKLTTKSEEDLLASLADEREISSPHLNDADHSMNANGDLLIAGDVNTLEKKKKKKKLSKRSTSKSEEDLLASLAGEGDLPSPHHNGADHDMSLDANLLITGDVDTLEKKKKKKKTSSKKSRSKSQEDILSSLADEGEISSPRYDMNFGGETVLMTGEVDTLEKKKKKKKASSRKSKTKSEENLLISLEEPTEPTLESFQQDPNINADVFNETDQFFEGNAPSVYIDPLPDVQPMHIEGEDEHFVYTPSPLIQETEITGTTVVTATDEQPKKKKKKKTLKKSTGSKSSLLASEEDLLSLQSEQRDLEAAPQDTTEKPQEIPDINGSINIYPNTLETPEVKPKKKKKKLKASLQNSTEDLIDVQKTEEFVADQLHQPQDVDVGSAVMIEVAETPESKKKKKKKTSSKKLRASKSSLQASTDDLGIAAVDEIQMDEGLEQEPPVADITTIVVTESPELKKKKKKKDKSAKRTESKSSLQASQTSLQGSEHDMLSISSDQTNPRYSIKDIDDVIMGAEDDLPQSEILRDQPTWPLLSIENQKSPEPAKKKKKKKTKKLTGSKSSLVASEENLLSVDSRAEKFTLAEPGQISEHAVQHADTVFVTEPDPSQTKAKFVPVIKRKKKRSWKRSTPSETSSVYSEQSLNESFDIDREISPAPEHSGELDMRDERNNNTLYGEPPLWDMQGVQVSQICQDLLNDFDKERLSSTGETDHRAGQEQNKQDVMHSYGVDPWQDPFDVEKTDDTAQQPVMHSYGVDDWKDPLDIEDKEPVDMDSFHTSSPLSSPREAEIPLTGDVQQAEPQKSDVADLEDALREYLDPNLLVTEISVPDAQTRQIIDELNDEEQAASAELPSTSSPRDEEGAARPPSDTQDLKESALTIGQIIVESGNEQSDTNISPQHAEENVISPGLHAPKRLEHKYHSTENILADRELQVYDIDTKSRYHSTENILSEKKARAKSEDREFGDLPEERLRQYASAEVLDYDPDYSKLLTQKQRAKSMSALFYGKKRPARDVVCKTVRIFKGVRTITTVDEVITEVRIPPKSKELAKPGTDSKISVELPQIEEIGENESQPDKDMVQENEPEMQDEESPEVIPNETETDIERDQRLKTSVATIKLVEITETTTEEITEGRPNQPENLTGDSSDNEEHSQEKELLGDVKGLESDDSDKDDDFLHNEQVNGAPLESGEESEGTDAEKDISDDDNEDAEVQEPPADEEQLQPRSPKRVTISEEVIIHGEESDSGTTSSDNGDSSDSYEINSEGDDEHHIDNIWIGSLGNYLKTSKVAQQLVTQGLVLPEELGIENDVPEESPEEDEEREEEKEEENTGSDEYVEPQETIEVEPREEIEATDPQNEKDPMETETASDEADLDKARDEDEFEEEGFDETWQTEAKTSVEVTTETLVPVIISRDEIPEGGEGHSEVPKQRVDSSSSDDEDVIEAMVYDTYEVSQYKMRVETVRVYQNEDSEGQSEDDTSEPSPRGQEMMVTEVTTTEKYQEVPHEEFHFANSNGLEDVPEEDEEIEESDESAEELPPAGESNVNDIEGGAAAMDTPQSYSPVKPTNQSPDTASAQMLDEKAFVGSLVSNLGYGDIPDPFYFLFSRSSPSTSLVSGSNVKKIGNEDADDHDDLD